MACRIEEFIACIVQDGDTGLVHVLRSRGMSRVRHRTSLLRIACIWQGPCGGEEAPSVAARRFSVQLFRRRRHQRCRSSYLARGGLRLCSPNRVRGAASPTHRHPQPASFFLEASDGGQISEQELGAALGTPALR